MDIENTIADAIEQAYQPEGSKDKLAKWTLDDLVLAASAAVTELQQARDCEEHEDVLDSYEAALDELDAEITRRSPA